MIRKKKLMTTGKYYLLGLIAAVGIVSALWCQSIVSLADSTGTVSAESAKIRKETNTNSEVLGSVARGTTVSITDEVQDSSGTLWYQVSVDGKTGYIRSDLMNKNDGEQTGTGAPGALVAPDTVLDAQYATVASERINVRTGPSANESAVEKLDRGAQVIVSGETQGSDGKKWYYVTFTGSSGTEKSGFIRSDLLSLGDMVPVPEETEPEPEEIEPEPEMPVNDDYAVRYENADGSGTFEWYLYDYTDHANPDPKVYRVQDLMKVTQQRSEKDAADAKTVVRQRIVIVVLVVLMVLLIVVAVIMALKLRDVYYEDYEDEDEEEQEGTPTQRRRRSEEEQENTLTQRRRRTQEAEETPSQRRRRTAGQEETPTQRRRRTQEAEETPSQRRRRMEESEEASVRRRRRMEDEEEPTRRRQMRDEKGNAVREVEYHEDDAGSAPVKTTQKRKTKNFLLDDDEFEFEFLNMDDKN